MARLQLKWEGWKHMSGDAQRIDPEQVVEHLGLYTIGFLRVGRSNNGETVLCAGSGTLVDLHGVQGILTAAHVLRALPSRGLVGLVRFPSSRSRSQRLTFDIDHTRSVIIDENRRDDTGPDLAFLTLPQETIGALSARSSFFNLGMRRPINRERLEGPLCFDCVMGMVDERTASLGPKYGNPNRIQFTAFAINGLAKLLQAEPYDLLRLDPNNPTGDPITSFAGVSGGGLWRVIFRFDDEDKHQFDRAVLAGVAFFQGEMNGNVRPITCHGPRSVYETLYDRVVTDLGL